MLNYTCCLWNQCTYVCDCKKVLDVRLYELALHFVLACDWMYSKHLRAIGWFQNIWARLSMNSEYMYLHAIGWIQNTCMRSDGCRILARDYGRIQNTCLRLVEFKILACDLMDSEYLWYGFKNTEVLYKCNNK